MFALFTMMTRKRSDPMGDLRGADLPLGESRTVAGS